MVALENESLSDLVIMKELSLLPCSEAFDEEYNSTDPWPKGQSSSPCENVLFHFHKASEKTGSIGTAVHLANCISQINPDSVGEHINIRNQFVLTSLLS